jgi:peptidyl-prolyl cis-trans isomerase D
MLLLIVGLAGFGAGSFGGSFSSIGSVGNEKVPLKTYIRALNNQINQISQQTGQQFSLEQAKVLGVDRQVLEQVLAIAALDGQTKKSWHIGRRRSCKKSIDGYSSFSRTRW